MRPLCESEIDRLKEADFLDAIATKRGCAYVKLPIHYKVDCMFLFKGLPYAWGELKCRAISLSDHPDIIVSKRKIEAGIRLRTHLYGERVVGWSKKRESYPLKFVFFVRLMDGDYYHVIKTLEDYRSSIGGRTVQTGDEFDVEPVIHIPTSDFKRL